ncbi:MarR family winged helix-turn-helix transcriptional regulator [Amycolatopsis pigmentata]|uniref:MarR family winged helix-turn-helix transcriptional regulator n=1 Tax=Amycolatopsis pigmentata TaxID=450801 RepID=A0ABW5G5D0_9PSEU
MAPDQDLAELARTVREGVVRVSLRMRAERERGGPSPLVLAVLSRLYRGGTQTPKALADSERVHPQSLTRVLASLDRDGLVTRRPDPDDGRQVLIEITARGLETLRAYGDRQRRWLAEAMAETLTETERELLGMAAKLMMRVADW